MREVVKDVERSIARARAQEGRAERRPNLRADPQGAYLANLLSRFNEDANFESYLDRGEHVLKSSLRRAMALNTLCGVPIVPGKLACSLRFQRDANCFHILPYPRTPLLLAFSPC